MDTTEREPTRVLVIIRESSRHWQKDDMEIIDAALQLISREELGRKDYRFMAKEMWGTVSFLIIDIFNNDYDSDTAHLEGKNDLPVITVRFSKIKETVGFEGLPIKITVNQQLRQLHDYEGHGSKPPFYVDHTNGRVPTYPNPRTAVRKNSPS